MFFIIERKTYCMPVTIVLYLCPTVAIHSTKDLSLFDTKLFTFRLNKKCPHLLLLWNRRKKNFSIMVQKTMLGVHIVEVIIFIFKLHTGPIKVDQKFSLSISGSFFFGSGPKPEINFLYQFWVFLNNCINFGFFSAITDC